MIYAKTKVDDAQEGVSKVEIQLRSYVPAPLERLPASLEFVSPPEAKGFRASVSLDDKNIDFSKGITGKIKFDSLTVQCLAVYGCLIRKEDITIGAPITRSKEIG